MAEYVKICPQCGGRNTEFENTCAECGHFLGLVQPELFSEARPEPPEEAGAGGVEENVPEAAGEPRLYLESLESGGSYEVKSGDVVGQAHPTSGADVQMSDIPNLNYISREHCRFEFENNAWLATLLAGALNGAKINQAPMSPGARVRVMNGDELTIAAAPFRIRITD